MNRDEIRVQERASIREFLTRNQVYLQGRVLDWGCGIPSRCIKPQPYRDLVTGEYVPYDVGYPEPDGIFDSVLCTQVIQFIADPLAFLTGFSVRTTYFVMTYPTHWEEVEADDRWRFTRHGMEALFRESGYEIVVHDERWRVEFDGYHWAGGYGVVAKSQRSPHHP